MVGLENAQSTVILLAEVFSFVAAVAGVTASSIMFQSTKRFGTGILSIGFKRIAVGVVFVASGIIIDAMLFYVQLPFSNVYAMTLFLVKGSAFLIGTYIIVIGSKTTKDKLETLTGKV